MRLVVPCSSKGGYVLEFARGERARLDEAPVRLAALGEVRAATPVLVVADVDGVRVSVHPQRLLVTTRDEAVAQRVAERVHGALFGSAPPP